MSPSPIPSPYNFVPLAPEVFFPDWADRVSMDIPFRDGISGALQLRVTARTPIYIRAGGAHADRNAPEYQDFFRVFGPKGPYAIPGTSLKGMLRNVLEIISFSKMVGTRGATGRVADHRYAVRDLQNRSLYTGRITSGSVASGFKPKVRAAWLSQGDDGQWELRFCQYARVEQEHLEAHFQKPGRLADRQSADQKYSHIPPHTRIRFDAGPEQPHPHSHNKRLIYRRATNLGQGGTEGVVVLTGQPARRDGRPGKKHLEFIFFDPQDDAVPVPDTVKSDFTFAHTELGENRQPNAEWKFWKQRLGKGQEVPVFVLMDERDPLSISSMGLAMMFRLPYRHSIHETIAHTSQDHFDGGRRDLAELIFGCVEDTDGLRGRVTVDTLVAEGDPHPLDKVTTVLNGPKPTYYPNYVQQPRADGATGELKSGEYQTYMDELARIRGWKRYIVRPDAPDLPKTNPPPQTRGQVNLDVATSFCPLPAGTVFTGAIRLHNLRAAELGALIWTLGWGGNNRLRHLLGMGKPYGFGSVTVEVVESRLKWCDPGRTEPVDGAACRNAFEEMMDQWWKSRNLKGNWRGSDPLRALQTMADPAKDWPQETRYPRLGNGPRENEFVQHKNEKMALIDPLTVSSLRAPEPQQTRPPEPSPPLTPGEQFLQEMDRLSLGNIPRRMNSLGITPDSVSPDVRRQIHQRLSRKPGATTNWNFRPILEMWKPK